MAISAAAAAKGLAERPACSSTLRSASSRNLATDGGDADAPGGEPEGGGDDGGGGAAPEVSGHFSLSVSSGHDMRGAGARTACSRNALQQATSRETETTIRMTFLESTAAIALMMRTARPRAPGRALSPVWL